MKKTKEQIEAEIIGYLDETATHPGDGSQSGCGLRHGIACALGTSRKGSDVPRVTPVDFHHDGLTLWILADPGGKLGNIRSNRNVSVAVYSPMDHAQDNRSIQLFGKATLVTLRYQEEEFMNSIKRMGLLDAITRGVQGNIYGTTGNTDFDEALQKQLLNVTLIKIQPETIIHLIIRPGQAMEKLVWERSG